MIFETNQGLLFLGRDGNYYMANFEPRIGWHPGWDWEVCQVRFEWWRSVQLGNEEDF